MAAKKPGGRKIMVPAYFEPDMKRALDALVKATGVPAAEYIRQGITYVLSQEKRTRRRK